MSSEEEPEVQVSELRGFNRRGKLKLRKIRDEHGSLLVPLDRNDCNLCGLKRGQQFTTTTITKISLDKKGLGILNFMNMELVKRRYLVVIPVKENGKKEFDK